MFQYWSNIFAMLGVALIATAFFRPEDWPIGSSLGIFVILLGAWFHSLSTKRGKK